MVYFTLEMQMRFISFLGILFYYNSLRKLINHCYAAKIEVLYKDLQEGTNYYYIILLFLLKPLT